MPDTLFHIIEGAQVILRSRGVYFQRELYYRGDRMFAKHGGGYIRLGPDDSTSAPAVSWEPWIFRRTCSGILRRRSSNLRCSASPSR